MPFAEMLPWLLDLALGFAIGMTLGLLGGGGSILTVPALVYLVGQQPQSAVATSLAIVGANSALGAYFHNSHGSMNWKVALLFGGAGMLVAYLAADLSNAFSPAGLLVAFAGLMLVTAALMLFRKETTPSSQPVSTNWWVVLASGAGVGLLTGILGVGGGFLIVPALVMLVGLPMSQAVGTSLAVIAANSLAGFAGHLDGLQFDPILTIVFVAAGLLGTLAGTKIAQRLDAERLKRIFALFVIALAFFLLVDNLPKILV